MKQSATLIFDIGKTAKKAIVFDEAYNSVEELVEYFPETKDEDDFLSEDLSLVSKWVLERIQYYLNHPKFDISHINFSAYGASLVHLDKDNKPLKSFYNYLKPLPEDCKTNFLSRYNSDGSLLAVTASPWLGLLNSGLQLFWMKQKKTDQFTIIQSSLHFPQYFTFLLTGKKFSEITSIGCHTMLWDFKKEKYHSWVEKEKLIGLFPPVQNPTHAITQELYGKNVTIGIGVHDSSAALMPYLATMTEPFILLSTGTWNISFNPFNSEPLTKEELSKDCLCYLTYEGNPVKASRIFLGHEHELQVKSIADAFHITTDEVSNVTLDEQLYTKLSSENSTDKTVYPLGMEGTGPLPEKSAQKTIWENFETMEEAYHQMIRELVKWQLLSVALVNPKNQIKSIIVVGGFTKNQLFLEILKRDAKNLKILLSDHPRSAALGAAWLVSNPLSYENKKELLNVSFL